MKYDRGMITHFSNAQDNGNLVLTIVALLLQIALMYSARAPSFPTDFHL
jgi:hypothetical protein